MNGMSTPPAARRPGGRGAGVKPSPTPCLEGFWVRVRKGFATPVLPFVAASHDEPGARPLTG